MCIYSVYMLIFTDCSKASERLSNEARGGRDIFSRQRCRNLPESPDPIPPTNTTMQVVESGFSQIDPFLGRSSLPPPQLYSRSLER